LAVIWTPAIAVVESRDLKNSAGRTWQSGGRAWGAPPSVSLRCPRWPSRGERCRWTTRTQRANNGSTAHHRRGAL